MLDAVRDKIKADYKPGQRAHVLWDIDEYGQECFTVQRIVETQPSIASSLKEPEHALGLVNDQIANEAMRRETERLLVK